MQNPLLIQGALPTFSSILPEHIEPAVKQVIAENRAELQTLLASGNALSWDQLILALEAMSDKLAKVWSPVSHLHAVLETEALRAAYNACLPLITEYHTELMQNEILYKALESIAERPEYDQLNSVQRKILDNELRDFRLAGVGLPAEKKTRFAELQKTLTTLTTQFAENILDATNAWSLLVTDVKELAGLPEANLKIAEQNAQQHGEKGWSLTLDYPCYAAAIKYLSNRDLRFKMYQAYSTRASDQGPNAGRWDNSQVIEDILAVRHELATLLGFKSFAEYSLATKMAKKPEQVLGFLEDLVSRSKKYGERDVEQLTEFAQSIDQLERLEPWDLSYYAEKLRQKNYALSQEEVRPYFPAPKVLSGMFEVMNKLFGLKIVEQTNVDTWHSDVQFFAVYDESDVLRGFFYTDLYARRHKRDGAWMDDARVRRRLENGEIQLPVAYLTCNFTRPVDGKPSYLTHDEVQTVFHEFGHCLHHMLTKVDYSSVSGINGVPWDAVEFPSQFLESWCWDKESLQLVSQHEITGEPIPDDLYRKLIAAKNFQPGLHILRQLEFALFDFRLHLQFDPTLGPQAQSVLNDVRKKVAVLATAPFNRFQHSFSHIFAGGYAAGYYSYEWAQVLSTDAFSRFEEEGVFNAKVGREFMRAILEQGGTKEPMELFVAFRGREPKIDALLRQSGLV